MSENKRKLRADAVERLKNSVGARFKPDAAIIAIVGGRVGQSDWSLECDKLIDLLTDDEQPETFHDDFYDCESTVDVSEDTREKLEEDWVEFYTTHERECLYQSDVGKFVFDLLDRQAAIAEREGREAWHKAASGEIYQARYEADELREKYNDLPKRRQVDERPCINGLRETTLDYTERLGEAAKTLHIETRCTYDDLRVLCKTLMGVFE